MICIQTNDVVASVLEMCGNITPKGYSLFVNDKEVPILLNKDATTEYPEIRVSPFIAKKGLNEQKYINPLLQEYRNWETGDFQIDIYSQSLIEAQNIFDVLKHRLYDFFNLETVIYNWNPNFKEIDDFVYKNIDYAITGELYKDIYSVSIKNHRLKRVFRFKDLDYDTWYADKDALYVKTKQDLRHLDIKVLMQGRLFKNGDAYSDRGIHYHEFSDQRNLSALEDNEVERISFDLYIIFSYKRKREAIPKVKRVRYPHRPVR